MAGGEPVEVTVRFAPVVARAAQAARVVRDRRVDRRDDGSADISYRVADVPELIRWVLSWGAQAEILGPPAVRAEALQLIEELRSRYRRPAPLPS
jgi:proteasome accessory factor B